MANSLLGKCLVCLSGHDTRAHRSSYISVKRVVVAAIFATFILATHFSDTLYEEHLEPLK